MMCLKCRATLTKSRGKLQKPTVAMEDGQYNKLLAISLPFALLLFGNDQKMKEKVKKEITNVFLCLLETIYGLSLH
jgi:hypothetical protein